MTALRADAPLIPSFAPLTERLRALVDTLPEAQWPPQVFLDELDDVDAPSDTVDDNNASVELTGAQDLSQYLDASALPFDAPAPAQDTEDTQPQSDDAPIAVDALADAEAEHDSALAVDAPASHTVDDLGHLASHEHVDASAESAHAPSDDALVPAVVSAQLADAISTHADTVAVEEPADAEAALGDAQTLAAADAEQATDTHAQHVPTHDDQGAAGADDAVESSEALASVYTGTALAEDADATNAEDWTPGTPALDSVPTDQEGHAADQLRHEHADTHEHAGEQPADEAAQHGDAALPHAGQSHTGEQQHAEVAAPLGEHADIEAYASSDQQVDSGESAASDAQWHAGEQVPSEQGRRIQRAAADGRAFRRARWRSRTRYGTRACRGRACGNRPLSN